jgi:protein-tyrosine phosphatase
MSSVVTYVEVETQPDGELLVRWELEGEPVAVDVALGRTADHLDHRHETTVPAGQNILRLPGDKSGRLFVSVAPRGGGSHVMAADRRVPFEGVTNFRDLGGYRTRSGTRTRWGLVFRADSLHGLSPGDHALYDRLGIGAIYDLRGEVERYERPNPVASRPLTILGRSADSDPPALPSGTTQAEGERILRDLYVGILDHSAAQIGELFTLLSDKNGLPAVFHCHAGKDRTGIVAALLLATLNVERDKILDDYELTARYRQRIHQESSYQRLIESGLSPEAAAGVLTTPRWAMQHALEELDRRYGGIAGYLQGPVGMHPDRLRSLRQRLLEPA